MLYNLYTKSYDKLHELPAYVELLQRSTNDVKGTRVLEAGVGTGNTLSFLEKKEVYGIDLDEDRLNQARKKKKKKHYIKKGDVQELPFEKNFFDTVICVNTLNFVENDDLAIQEFSRVLKKNGRLIIHVPKKNSKFSDMFKRAIKSLGVFSTLRLLPWVIIVSLANARIYKTMRTYTVSGIKDKLNKHGFSLKEIDDSTYLNQGIYCIAEKS